MTRWLLRRNEQSRFALLGPMSREEVLDAVRSGQVELNDEACVEGGYWFSFHESEELHKNLAVSWNQLKKEAGELPEGDQESTQFGPDNEETDEITITGTETRAPRQMSSIRKVSAIHQPSESRESILLTPESEESSEASAWLGVPVWIWALVGAGLVWFLRDFFGSEK